MTDAKRIPPEPTPWDRLGIFLGDLGVVGKNIADRNLTLWSNVSRNLREGSYTADNMTNDAARAVDTAITNVQEAWEAVIRPPERELVAYTLPTAFLLFRPRRLDDGCLRYDPPDPVWMRVRGADADSLLPQAEIELTGNTKGVKALRQRLSTQLGKSRQAYLLQTANPMPPKPHVDKPKPGDEELARGVEAPEPDVPELVPGAYGGTVYIKTPNVRPIANLRIIVE